ncbi:MAG: class I SAM-dependent rRNA methyltransferase [Elusimicrobia bacterium]|nr:class I SAM-dependent rRNA methyltransferase [Elusimicrobiota bacterium]
MGVETGTGVTVKLKPREEDRLLGGHAWVFSNEIESVEGPAEPGAAAIAVDARGVPLGIGFYHPNSLIAWRLVSRRVVPIDAAFIRERLARALKYRERQYPGETSYRLCFGESDGLPGLVADRYGDVVVLQVLSAGIERRLDLVAQALTELVGCRGIYLKNDHPTRSLEGLPPESRVLQGDVPPRVTIEEAGLRYLTPLTEGQKTGFYFDQRDNRARLAPYFKGRHVMDLYCYTGAFALNAARHGAAKVLGLDSSAPAVELARANARLNGLAAEFDEGDAEEVLRAFAEARQPFEPDFILLDPPSFVPSKRHLMKALRAYVRLNLSAMRVLPRGGLLATSTCSHHVEREAFLGMLREAAGRSEKSFRLLELGGQAKDHPVLLAMPETEYLHFALLEAV